MIKAIAVIDHQRGLARAGHIPWDIPADRRYFRQQTTGGTVLMGRTTYEQFDQPLPGRRNVVCSRNLSQLRLGFELVTDAGEYLQLSHEDVWIIGGADLYTSTLAYCDELYLTHIAADFTCDQFFPDYQQLFYQQYQSPAATQNGLDYTFAVYKRR